MQKGRDDLERFVNRDSGEQADDIEAHHPVILSKTQSAETLDEMQGILDERLSITNEW